MQNNFDWAHGFIINFALSNGASPEAAPIRRFLSQMTGMYADQQAAEALLKYGDPLIYEYYDLGAPDNAGDLAFGSSITYPGKIGDEYFMTKGHLHAILETAEVYNTLSGTGFMLMENGDGDVRLMPLQPGVAVYVPKGYAHRSVNSGSEPLVTFFTLRADAGHDYGTIEAKGFRKLVVERNGRPELVDNPRWK